LVTYSVPVAVSTEDSRTSTGQYGSVEIFFFGDLFT